MEKPFSILYSEELKATGKRLSAGVCFPDLCGWLVWVLSSPLRKIGHLGRILGVSTVFGAPNQWAFDVCHNAEYLCCGKRDDSRWRIWAVCWFPRTIDWIGGERGDPFDIVAVLDFEVLSVVCKPFYFKGSAVLW